MLTTIQVAKLLEISIDELKILRHSIDIEGLRYTCKNGNVAYLFTKDQVILLLKEQLMRSKREQMKEKSRKLLKDKIKNRQIDQRNKNIKVLPDWK